MDKRSVWTANVRQPRFPRLEEDLEVDVVIVGAGVVGLTTALLAQRDGARVAVLEAERVGSGTTGRTTGKVTSQHSLIYATLIDRHGESRARQYAEANEAGVHKVAELADELGVSCDLTWAPSYAYTRDPEQRQQIADEVDAAQRLGLPATLTDSTDLPFPVEAAVRFDQQIHYQPQRYLVGLARAFTKAGGQLFEHSRVVGVSEKDDAATVTTEGATVVGRQVLLATLLPVRYAGGYFAMTRPSRSYGIAVQLSSPAPTSMAIGVDSPTRSTRPWPAAGANGLIVVGNGHETGKQDDTEQLYADLERWARSEFDVASVDHRWSSQDFSTADKMPYVGRAHLTRRTLVATGFAKWGLSNGTAAAMILADLVADRSNPWFTAFDATRIGDPEALMKMAVDNIKVGQELVSGHLSRLAPSSAADLSPGEGAVTEVDGHAVGAYRDQRGQLHGVTLTCTHLGCRVRWNTGEKSWDCACHGSRFDVDGTVLDGPAVEPLKRVDLDGS